MSNLNDLKKELQSLKDNKQKEILQRFFKTSPGEYGEGDVFLGIKVPVQRGVAKKYRLSLEEIENLLDSEIHEYRLIGLFILIDKYAREDYIRKKKIFEFYLRKAHDNKINNWDLVDLSAPNILGKWLLENVRDKRILYKLVKSKNLWEKRIAVVSCYTLIRQGDFSDILKLGELLLKDNHDLIHKAIGWMLREVGKRQENVLLGFLDRHYKEMPRTMLRYSIERLDEEKRKGYMGK